jgi:hypothetical protein
MRGSRPSPQRTTRLCRDQARRRSRAAFDQYILGDGHGKKQGTFIVHAFAYVRSPGGTGVPSGRLDALQTATGSASLSE